MLPRACAWTKVEVLQWWRSVAERTQKKVEEGVFLTLYKILPAASCACMAHAVWMYGENTYSISPSFGA